MMSNFFFCPKFSTLFINYGYFQRRLLLICYVLGKWLLFVFITLSIIYVQFIIQSHGTKMRITGATTTFLCPELICLDYQIYNIDLLRIIDVDVKYVIDFEMLQFY